MTTQPDWEKELTRLASLVGTDAKDPERKLLDFIHNYVKAKQEEARSEERQKILEDMIHEVLMFRDGFSHPKDCAMCKSKLDEIKK